MEMTCPYSCPHSGFRARFVTLLKAQPNQLGRFQFKLRRFSRFCQGLAFFDGLLLSNDNANVTRKIGRCGRRKFVDVAREGTRKRSNNLKIATATDKVPLQTCHSLTLLA